MNDTEVVEVIQSPTSLQCFTLTLGIRGLGSALVTAVDIGLAVPIVASALVLLLPFLFIFHLVLIDVLFESLILLSPSNDFL